MADSNIICSGLVANSGVGQVVLSWTVIDPEPGRPPYLAFAKTEIYASASNNRLSAFKIAEVPTNGYTHAGVTPGDTNFYWVRPVNAAGIVGEFYPISATAGIAATADSAQPGPGTITAIELAPEAVTSPAIAPGAVGTTHIADAAIERAKIANAAIGSAQIEDAAITNAKVGNLSADKITFGTLSGIYITAVTINGGTITGGSISGTVINGGTINSPRINGGYLDVDELTASYIYGARIQTQELGERIDMSLGQLLVYNSLLQNTIRLGASPFGSTPPLGVLSTSPSGFAASIQNTSAGAVQGVSPTWAFYASGGGGYGPFTGSHELLWPVDLVLPQLGDLVMDDGVIFRSDLSNTLCLGKPSENERPALGVFVGELDWSRTAGMPDDLPEDAFEKLGTVYRLIRVNALGEGQMNVCDEGGPIMAGDLLVASSIPGKAKKQSDDFMRGSTVARSRETVVYDMEGRALAAVIYVGG